MYQTAFFFYTLFVSLKIIQISLFPFLGGSNLIYSSKPLNITDSTEGNIEKVGRDWSGSGKLWTTPAHVLTVYLQCIKQTSLSFPNPIKGL